MLIFLVFLLIQLKLIPTKKLQNTVIANIRTNYDDSNQEVDEELKKAGKSDAEIASIGPHKVFKARGFTVNSIFLQLKFFILFTYTY